MPNPEQLRLIELLNKRVQAAEGCPHGCKGVCRRATQVASERLADAESSTAVQEFPDCPNALIVTMFQEDIIKAG